MSQPFGMKEFQPFFPKCLPSFSLIMKNFIRTRVFSNINIITLSHAELRQWYHIICYIVQLHIAPVISKMSFIAVVVLKSRLQLEILYWFWLSNFFSLLYHTGVLHLCLFLMILQLPNALFYRMFLCLDFSDCFLMIRFRVNRNIIKKNNLFALNQEIQNSSLLDHLWVKVSQPDASIIEAAFLLYN